MRRFHVFSLALAGIFAISTIGCDGGASGGTAGAGGTSSTGGSGGETSTGGAGGTGGGSGGAGGTSSAGGTGGATAGMTLTSPVVTEGGMMPVDATCAGTNVSPQLDWTGVPAGTQSLAVLFEDETISLIHWAIWNIPADATGLPAQVENAQMPANVPGSKQAVSYDGQTYGYLGPCPNGNLHTYRFTVYALDVTPLPLAGIGTADSAKDLILDHDLASGTLSAQSDAKQ